MIKHLFFCFLFLFSASLFAAQKTILTVYTYPTFTTKWGAGPFIQREFEKVCDCKLQFISNNGSAALLNRLKIEGKKSKADVVLGLDDTLIAQAQTTSLFTPHQITADFVDNTLTTPDFLPYDFGFFALIYNSKKIATPPDSFASFLASPYTLIYSDPRSDTSGLGFLLWVNALYGEQSAAIWQKIARKTVTVTPSWSESYGLFLKGEADFVLSYVTSPVYHQLYEKNSDYRAAIFKEGHYKQTEYSAILAHTPHLELARAFLAFLLTKEVQQEIALRNIMQPVIKMNLPPLLQALPDVPELPAFPAETLRNDLKNGLEVWKKSVTH